MNELSDEILEKFRNKKVAIFIDDANLFYMQKRIGWEIDWQKTKQFFEKHTTNSQWFYYLGMPLAGKGGLTPVKRDTFLAKLDSFKEIVWTF